MTVYEHRQGGKALRILQLGEVPPPYGGVSSFVHGTSKSLAARGHTVIVAPLSFQPKEKDPVIESERNYEVVYCDLRLDTVLKLAWRFGELFVIASLRKSHRRVFLEGVYKLLRSHSGIRGKVAILYRLAWVFHICKSRNINIILGHHGGERGLLAVILGRILGIPGYPFLHGGVIFYNDDAPVTYKNLVATVIKYGNEFLFCSSNSIKRAVSLGMPEYKAVHVGLGVDCRSIRPRPIPPLHPFHILSIGYLSPHRGLEQLIRATQIIKHRIASVRVSIVGPDPHQYWPKLESLVVDLALADSVKYLGILSEEQYRSLLRSVHVGAFLLQGEKTGSLAACLEVQAAGIPVLTTGLGGLDEYVEHGTTGLICGTSPEEAAEALFYMFNMYKAGHWDPDRIHKYAKEHSWEKVAANLEKTFQQASLLEDYWK